MKRNQRNLILLVVGVLVLLGAVAAGVWLSSQNAGSQYTGNQVQQQISESFSDQPWFEGVEVTAYDGFAEISMEDPAASVSVNITVEGFTADSYDQFITLLPSFGNLIMYYGVIEDVDAHYMYLYGFSAEDFSSPTINSSVHRILSLQDTNRSQYLKIQPGAVSVDSTNTNTGDSVVMYMNVDSLVPETVTQEMETYLDDMTDVIILTYPNGSPNQADSSSYIQTGAATETADSFQDRLTFALQFAEKEFTTSNQITVSSVSDKVYVEWLVLDDGQSAESLQSTGDALLSEYGYPFTVTYKDLNVP